MTGVTELGGECVPAAVAVLLWGHTQKGRRAASFFGEVWTQDSCPWLSPPSIGGDRWPSGDVDRRFGSGSPPTLSRSTRLEAQPVRAQGLAAARPQAGSRAARGSKVAPADETVKAATRGGTVIARHDQPATRTSNVRAASSSSTYEPVILATTSAPSVGAQRGSARPDRSRDGRWTTQTAVARSRRAASSSSIWPPVILATTSAPRATFDEPHVCVGRRDRCAAEPRRSDERLRAREHGVFEAADWFISLSLGD